LLGRKKVVTNVVVDAKKHRLGKADALKLASESDRIYVSKGKKVVEIDLRKNRPEDDELTELLLGPTGNLRAPTLRTGRTLIVGFDEQVYLDVLG
jgi:arsenate reductase-like glutaredoxin family protein